jgi:hypothetical protein
MRKIRKRKTRKSRSIARKDIRKMLEKYEFKAKKKKRKK